MVSGFITFEGCEGCGKSTQVALLKKYFADNNIPALFTREPGGAPLSEKIRGLLLDKGDFEVGDTAELLLYAAARAQHIEEVILPALKEGKTVVCDRFTDSTMAYQGYARGLGYELVGKVNDIALGSLKIDLTIFLDISPAAAFARKGGPAVGDRMESQTIDFHNRVYGGYKAIAAAEPHRVKIVDASGSIEDTFEKIRKVLI